MQKRIIMVLLAALFLIAFVPALGQPADAAYQKACPGCDTYDQLMALVNVSHDFDGLQFWFGATASLEIPYQLPIALPASADTRAPPA
jgi:hypothetical protein